MKRRRKLLKPDPKPFAGLDDESLKERYELLRHLFEAQNKDLWKNAKIWSAQPFLDMDRLDEMGLRWARLSVMGTAKAAMSVEVEKRRWIAESRKRLGG